MKKDKNKKRKIRKAKKADKKAQQEIFGFVIIILLVIVIGVVIFAFSLQRSIKKPTIIADVQVNNLLNSIMQYSTDCQLKKLSEVIVMCYNAQDCSQTETACNYAQKKINEILNASFPALGYGYFSGYNFTVGSINIGAGEKTPNVAVGFYLIPIPPTQTTQAGSLEAKLYIYYRTLET